MGYKAGGYIQIEILNVKSILKILILNLTLDEHPGEPNKFQLEWDKFKLWDLKNEKFRIC